MLEPDQSDNENHNELWFCGILAALLFCVITAINAYVPKNNNPKYIEVPSSIANMPSITKQ